MTNAFRLGCIAAVLVQLGETSEDIDWASSHGLNHMALTVIPHFSTDPPSAATPRSSDLSGRPRDQAFTPQDLASMFRAKSPPPPGHGLYGVDGKGHFGSPFGYQHSVEQPPPPAPPPPRPPPWGTWFLQPLYHPLNEQFIQSEPPAREKAISFLGMVRETAGAAGGMLSSPAAGALALAAAAVAMLRRGAARARVFASQEATRQDRRCRGPPAAALV